MPESTHISKIDADIESVYKKITDPTDFEWREDLAKVEQIDENNFTETVIDGSTNQLTVIKRIPNEYYEYALQNKNFVSRWRCTFRKLDEDSTEITITEQIEFPKGIVGFVSGHVVKLDKIHKTYVRNLVWSLLDLPPHPAEIAAAEAEEKRLAEEAEREAEREAKKAARAAAKEEKKSSKK